MNMVTNFAKLYLIPTTLSPEINSIGILACDISKLTNITSFIVETAKTARAHLKHLQLATPINQLEFQELNKHNQDYTSLIKFIQEKQSVGLISDCGCPAIADPGAKLVSLCHQNNIEVIPLVGASSIILGLMSSGLNGQNFCFNGYLDKEEVKRNEQMTHMLNMVQKHNQTQIIIEAPFRNAQVYSYLLNKLPNNYILSLAINLMSPEQQIISKPVEQHKNLNIQINKQEVIFFFGAPL